MNVAISTNFRPLRGTLELQDPYEPEGTRHRGLLQEPILSFLTRPIYQAKLRPVELHISLIGRKNLSGEIYRQIRRAIADGHLRPGDCLPASRDLARSLKVSRTTVTVAYDRLAGEGFVITRLGAGTYVSKLPDNASPGEIGPKACFGPERYGTRSVYPPPLTARRSLTFAPVFPMHHCSRTRRGVG